MIKWAIHHKSTGRFMPQANSKKHGYTHDEPAIMEESNWCPRLFGREQDAKAALTWWLKGETVARWAGGLYTNAWGEADDDLDYEWHTDPLIDRKAEDMEVVKVKIEVTK